MSENLDLNQNKPEGKGLAVTGFILSLVGLIFASIVMGGSYLASGSKVVSYIWVVVCILSVVLSVMGMSKLGKTGGKKGLAVAGLVIGIVAVVWSAMVLIGLSALDAGLDKAGADFEGLGDAMKDLKEMQQ